MKAVHLLCVAALAWLCYGAHAQSISGGIMDSQPRKGMSLDARDSVRVGTDLAQPNATTQHDNTGVAYQPFPSITTGYSNSSFGKGSAFNLTTGIYNAAYGADSLHTLTGGDHNTAIGTNALYTISGTTSRNTAVGDGAMQLNDTSPDNTAVGYSALLSHTGSNGKNAALGSVAGYYVTTGWGNTFGGYSSGYDANNVGDANRKVTTDDRLTLLGYNTHKCGDGSILTNSTAIGNGACVTKSNQFVGGNTAVIETIVRGAALFDIAYQTTTAKGLGVWANHSLSSPNTSAPADTAENVLGSCAFPGNAMGINGKARVRAVIVTNNDASAKTIQIRFGATIGSSTTGTTYMALAMANFATVAVDTAIANFGATNSQINDGTSGSIQTQASSGALITSSIDTTTTWYATVTAIKADSTDTVTLKRLECSSLYWNS